MSLLKKLPFFTFITAALWPVIIWAEETSTKLENPLAIGGGALDPNELFARVISGITIITGALTLTIIIIGGYRILTAAGNQENYAKGKQMIVYAVLGMLLTIGSYTILNTTIKTITDNSVNVWQMSLVDPTGFTKNTVLSTFYGKKIINPLMGLLGAVALLICVYGGVLWMTAAGNEERISKARTTLLYAVFGIAIILGSYTFVNFIYTPAYNLLTQGAGAIKIEKFCVNLQDKNVNGKPCTDDNMCGEGGTCQPFKIDIIKDETRVCFRQKKLLDGKIDISYGAKCTEEKLSECSKEKGEYKKGKILYKFEKCNEVGYCIQTNGGAEPLPGGLWANQIKKEECKPEIFGSTAKVVKIDNSLGCDSGVDINLFMDKNKCYATVNFVAGYDYLGEEGETNRWACKVTPSDSNGLYYIGATPQECKESGGRLLNRVRENDIGACVQNDLNRSYKICIDEVIKGRCTMTKFPAAGTYVLPWGCEKGAISQTQVSFPPLKEIDGKCYVEDIQWYEGKNCKQITGTQQQMGR